MSRQYRRTPFGAPKMWLYHPPRFARQDPNKDHSSVNPAIENPNAFDDPAPVASKFRLAHDLI